MSGYVTGIYVRIQRDGRYQSLDVATLTDSELEALFVDPDVCRKFAIGLAAWIRDHIEFVPSEEEDA